MNKKEIDNLEDYLRNKLPKIELPIPITTFGSVDLEDLLDSIKKFKKVPTIDELITENRKLKHQLEEKDKIVKKQNKIINKAYNNIESTYNWRKNHSTPSTIDVPLMTLCEEQLEILERGKNENSNN